MISVTAAVSESEAQMIEISITDDGPGIPESEHQRVLQPFYSTRAQGTGLGLPLVQRLVYAHGGHRLSSVQPHGLRSL